MVKRIVPVMAACAALCLSSCQVFSLFFASVFPVTVTQTVARLDLSARIPEDRAKQFKLSEIVSGGRRIYILCSDQNYGGTALIVMNENLEVVQAMAQQYLAGITGNFNGSFAMVDIAGDIIVGNLRFSLQPDGRLLPMGTAVPAPLNSPGFPVSISFQDENIVDIHGDDANLLRHSVYNSGWGFLADKSVQITDSMTYSYELNSVFSAPDSSGGNVVLIFRRKTSEDEPSLYHVMKVPKADFMNGGSMPDPLIPAVGPLPYSSLSLTDVASDLFGYWNAGGIDRLVRYDHQPGDFVLYDVEAYGEAVQGTLHFRDADTEVRTVYAMAGDFSYTYDHKKRLITKFATWWPK